VAYPGLRPRSRFATASIALWADQTCYYRDQRLGLEYDGGTHRDALAEDNRRQNRLLDAGVRLLRFTAGDIFQTPDLVVSLVTTALTR